MVTVHQALELTWSATTISCATVAAGKGINLRVDSRCPAHFLEQLVAALRIPESQVRSVVRRRLAPWGDQPDTP